MLRIDATSSRELQALLLSIRRADREIQAQIRKHTKPMVQTEWQKSLAQEAMTRFEHRVLVDTARVTVSNQNIKLKAGQLAKKLSGGARAFELSKQAEFGSSRSNQFRKHNKKGYVVYPAAARIIPRIAALWTQTAVRTMHEAFERKL